MTPDAAVYNAQEVPPLFFFIYIYTSGHGYLYFTERHAMQAI